MHRKVAKRSIGKHDWNDEDGNSIDEFHAHPSVSFYNSNIIGSKSSSFSSNYISFYNLI